MTVDQHLAYLGARPRVQHNAGTPAPASAAAFRGRSAGCCRASRTHARSPAPRSDRAACRRLRHERLRQNGDLTDHFRGDVQHGALPHRIGLGQRPRRLLGEVLIGVRHDRPDVGQHMMQLLRLHRVARPADHAVGSAEHRLVFRAEKSGRRQRAVEPPRHHDSERCARLPRSLARSALMRLTIASWL